MRDILKGCVKSKRL